MLSLPACRVAFFCVAAFGLCTSPGWAQTGTKTRPTAPAPKSKPAAPPSESKIQPASGSDKPQKPQRPPSQELRIEPLEPELEKLLQEWERVSSKFERLSGEHERIVYNKVFEVEKYAQGQFYYEGPDKGRIDLEPYKLGKNQAAKRENPKTGNPYRVEADKQTKWICTGKEVLTIDEEEKTFEAFPLPPELQGKNIIHGPLPFLFGMKADEAKRRFQLSFTAPKKNTDKVVWITAKPRRVMDHENFKEATIILDRKRFVPMAVKLLDPSENLETVYSFKEIHINNVSVVPQIFRKDPFHPNLKSYKMMLPQEAALADPKAAPRRGEPAGKASAIRQVGNTTAGSEAGMARPSKTANAGSKPASPPAPKIVRPNK